MAILLTMEVRNPARSLSENKLIHKVLLCQYLQKTTSYITK